MDNNLQIITINAPSKNNNPSCCTYSPIIVSLAPIILSNGLTHRIKKVVKINQIKFIKRLNKNGIACIVGSCPEIYREKIFKKLNFYPKKRLPNAKLLGETSVMFRINPNKNLSLIKREINVIKKILNFYTKS